MKYVLENSNEAARLERQSQSSLYDPESELQGLKITDGQQVLDAGCGSGLVARWFAEKHPKAKIHGIDVSDSRVSEAQKLALDLQNVQFRVGNVKDPISGEFDWIVCRYVLEHMDVADQFKVVSNLTKTLSSRGTLCLVDIDGYMFNIYPRTPFVEACLKKFEAVQGVDLFVGRKLTHHLIEAGLEKVSWRIQTLAMNEPQLLSEEMQFILERFEHNLPAMASVLGSQSQAERFQKEYIELLQRPGTNLFYNKFIAMGRKPAQPRLKLVAV